MQWENDKYLKDKIVIPSYISQNQLVNGGVGRLLKSNAAASLFKNKEHIQADRRKTNPDITALAQAGRITSYNLKLFKFGSITKLF